jgi:hypothetical protein
MCRYTSGDSSPENTSCLLPLSVSAVVQQFPLPFSFNVILLIGDPEIGANI